jgi:hypothetical protein
MSLDLRGKKILIFQQRNWGRTVGHFLAKKLQAEGCRLAALTLKKTSHRFTASQTEVQYEQIVNLDDITDNPQKYLTGENITLADVCRELKIDTVWPLLNSNRNLVKSYRRKFFYSYRKNVSDEHMIAYFMAYYRVVRDLCASFKPDAVVMAAFVFEGHVMLDLFAKKLGIPVMALSFSKIPGYYIFSRSYQSTTGAFFQRLRDLNDGREKSPNRQKARQYIQEFRQQFKKSDSVKRLEAQRLKRKSFFQKVRGELAPYYHALRYILYGSENECPNLGPQEDWRPPRILLRDHYLRKRYQKFADNYFYYPFDQVQKFVYFPLQVQPEVTIDLNAPFFSNQIETARLVAMALPDDYTLVVKDHPIMAGKHSPSYLEKVALTPNVKLIDYRIPTEQILKRVALVVSSNGTSMTEAAFYSVPAIQLGELGITQVLPNVTKHTDMTTLAKKIKAVLFFDLHTAEYERQLENFVAAVFDTGINIDYHRAWHRGEGNLEEIWQGYKQELLQENSEK